MKRLWMLSLGAAVLSAAPLLACIARSPHLAPRATQETPAARFFDLSAPPVPTSFSNVTVSPQLAVNPAAPIELPAGRSITVGKDGAIGNAVKPVAELAGMRATIPAARMHGVEPARAIAPNPAAPTQQVRGTSIIAPR